MNPGGWVFNYTDFFGGKAPVPGGFFIAEVLGFLTGFKPRLAPPFVTVAPSAVLFLGPEALGGIMPNEFFGAPEHVDFFAFISAFTGRTNFNEYIRAWELKLDQRQILSERARRDSLRSLPMRDLERLAAQLQQPRAHPERIGTRTLLIEVQQAIQAKREAPSPFLGAVQGAALALTPPPASPVLSVAADVGSAIGTGLVNRYIPCHYPADDAGEV